MQYPETSGSSLLEIAEQTLQTEILPHVSERTRAQALMIASAMRMVAREIAQSAKITEAGSALLAACGCEFSAGVVAAIRRGAYDADGTIHAVLWFDAAVRTSISKPSFLSERERMLVGLPP